MAALCRSPRGVSLARPDLHVFLFGGDGDGFSIGGNHLEHGARKNIQLTYVIMDNFVYGLTKKQTSPTSPIGYQSKTDPAGAIDQPVNPIKKLIAAGATFVARTHATQINHMIADDRARDGSRRLFCDRVSLRVRRVLSRRLRRRQSAQGRRFRRSSMRRNGTIPPEDEAAPRRHRRNRCLQAR